MIREEEKEEIRNKIDMEGFDYFFRDYSSCKEIEDKQFHKLRKAYIKAAKELEDYIQEE